ncbi:uncharacterized protein [Narcine bancroftii]|uniref:uncharacterized protein n=1 Tax=Narcine bancroftii TaxID=1343680 RepID=UPI003831F305
MIACNHMVNQFPEAIFGGTGRPNHSSINSVLKWSQTGEIGRCRSSSHCFEEAASFHLMDTVKDGPLYERIARDKPQVISKMKTLRRKLFQVVDHNGRSGRDQLDWSYYNLAKNIWCTCRSANPMSLIASERAPIHSPEASLAPQEEDVEDSDAPCTSSTPSPSFPLPPPSLICHSQYLESSHNLNCPQDFYFIWWCARGRNQWRRKPTRMPEVTTEIHGMLREIDQEDKEHDLLRGERQLEVVVVLMEASIQPSPSGLLPPVSFHSPPSYHHHHLFPLPASSLPHPPSSHHNLPASMDYSIYIPIPTTLSAPGHSLLGSSGKMTPSIFCFPDCEKAHFAAVERCCPSHTYTIVIGFDDISLEKLGAQLLKHVFFSLGFLFQLFSKFIDQFLLFVKLSFSLVLEKN